MKMVVCIGHQTINYDRWVLVDLSVNNVNCSVGVLAQISVIHESHSRTFHQLNQQRRIGRISITKRSTEYQISIRRGVRDDTSRWRSLETYRVPKVFLVMIGHGLVCREGGLGWVWHCWCICQIMNILLLTLVHMYEMDRDIYVWLWLNVYSIWMNNCRSWNKNVLLIANIDQRYVYINPVNSILVIYSIIARPCQQHASRAHSGLLVC